METIAAYAQDMSEFLNESELTERRPFIETFVKEIVVMPDNALMRYTVPMPVDSLIPGRNAEEMALNGSVLSTVKNGGRYWTRTSDLHDLNLALQPAELTTLCLRDSIFRTKYRVRTSWWSSQKRRRNLAVSIRLSAHDA